MHNLRVHGDCKDHAARDAFVSLKIGLENCTRIGYT
jgi:hypothetical protein